MDVNTSRPCGRDCYDRALAASHREAALTIGAAAVTMLYFWGALLLLEDSSETFCSLPLWFAAACLGGYVLSVVLVWLLVRCFFEDIDLDQAAEGCDGEER